MKIMQINFDINFNIVIFVPVNQTELYEIQ
nr:MAG TPA: hypothetical protein [Caudoviricetes sp.]